MARQTRSFEQLQGSEGAVSECANGVKDHHGGVAFCTSPHLQAPRVYTASALRGSLRRREKWRGKMHQARTRTVAGRRERIIAMIDLDPVRLRCLHFGSAKPALRPRPLPVSWVSRGNEQEGKEGKIGP